MQILINLLLKDVLQIALIFLPFVTFNIVAIKPHRRSLSPRKRTSRALNARAIRKETPCRALHGSGLPPQKSSPLSSLLLYVFILLFLLLVTYGSTGLIVMYLFLCAKLKIPALVATIYTLSYVWNDPGFMEYLFDQLYSEAKRAEYFGYNPRDSIAYHEILYADIAARAYWAALSFLARSIISLAITKWSGRRITPQQYSNRLLLFVPTFLLFICFGEKTLAILVTPFYIFAPFLKLEIYRLRCFFSDDEVDPSIEDGLICEQLLLTADVYTNRWEIPSDVLFAYPIIVTVHYIILGFITSRIVSCVIALGLDCFKPQQYSRPRFFHALAMFLYYFSLFTWYASAAPIRTLICFGQFVLTALKIAHEYTFTLSSLFFAYFGLFVLAVSIALAYIFEPSIDLLYYLAVCIWLGVDWDSVILLRQLHAQIGRLIAVWRNPAEVLEFVLSVLSSNPNITFTYCTYIGLIASLVVFCIIIMLTWQGSFKSRLKDSPSPALVHLVGTGLLLCIAAGIAFLPKLVRSLLVFLALVYRAILALLAMVLAIFVSMSWSPMHSLLALIGAFLLAVGVYFSSGAEFLGLAFLIVYVGAVAILFLFVIMLLNVKSLTSRAAQHVQRYRALSLVAGVCLGLATLFLNYCSFLYHRALDLVHSLGASVVAKLVYYVNYGASDVMAFATLYSKQAALFLTETVILLTAMLGAIVLATATLDEEEPLLSLNGPCFSGLAVCALSELITPATGTGLASALFGAVLLRPLVIPQYYYDSPAYITPGSLSKLLRDAVLDWWVEHRDEISLFFQFGGVGTLMHLLVLLFNFVMTTLYFSAACVELLFALQETALLSDMPQPPSPGRPELPESALAAVPSVEYADEQDDEASPAQGVINARMRVLEQAAYCNSIHPAFPGSLRQSALEDLQVARERLELANGRYYRATGNSVAVAEAQAKWDRLMLRKEANLPMSPKGLPSLRDPEFTEKVAAFASKGLRHEDIYILSTLDITEHVKARELERLLEQERARAAALAAYTPNSPAISDDIYRAAYSQTSPDTRTLFTKVDIVCQRMPTIPGSPYYDTLPGRPPGAAWFRTLGPITSAIMGIQKGETSVGATEAELLRDFHRATAGLRSPGDFRSLTDVSITHNHLIAFFYSYRPDRPCFNAFYVSEWYYAVRDKPKIASAFHFATSVQYKVNLSSTLTFTETLKHLSPAPTAAEKQVILNFLQTPSPYLHYNAGEQFLQDCRLHCRTGSWSVYRKLYVEATPTLNQFFVR